jgi:hypothetical protein
MGAMVQVVICIGGALVAFIAMMLWTGSDLIKSGDLG